MEYAYALAVWSLHLATLSNPIAMVQRDEEHIMSKYGTFDGTFDSVTDMLRELSLDTL